MESTEPLPLPKGVTAQSDLDGQLITLPGVVQSKREIARGIALVSLLPSLMLVVMGTILPWGSPITGWQFLMSLPLAALPPLFFLPFFGLGWLRAKGSPITVALNPRRFIRYKHLEIEQVIPTAAIQSVDAPAEGEPRIVLTVDWSTPGVEISHLLARNKDLIWRVQTRDQAQWLTDSIQRTCLPSGTREDVPEELKALGRPPLIEPV